ncbi:MAG: 30S ribosomal protein S8 [Candidatus Komeilibacteria bacterium]
MMTDPIADLLTRIRNASAVKKAEVVLPYSRLRHEVAKVLENEKYVLRTEKIPAVKPGEDGPRYDQLRIVMRYRSNGSPVIRHIKRVSRPSRKTYVTVDKIPTVLNGLGLAVLSTSKGLLTNIEARKAKIGGELMFEIW